MLVIQNVKVVVFGAYVEKYTPEYTRADIGFSFKINIFN